MFLEAHSFSRATLSENCFSEHYVRGQNSEHMFAPNEDYCLYIQRALEEYLLNIRDGEATLELHYPMIQCLITGEI